MKANDAIASTIADLPRFGRQRTPLAATPHVLSRVRIEDKAVINGRADVNQLVPFKYQWAWDKYLAACANHWMPQEIQMGRDVALGKILTDCPKTNVASLNVISVSS